MDTNWRVQCCISSFQIRLARQEAFAVDRAGGDEADTLAVRIDHRVAVVRLPNHFTPHFCLTNALTVPAAA